MKNNIIENTVSGIVQKVPQAESTYIGEDGLKHCSVCNRAVEVEVIDPFTKQPRIFPCICDCRIKEMEASKRAEKAYENHRRRKHCFVETNMEDWTFANDDRQNPKLSDAMQRYVNNFTEFRKDGKGLLMSGPVGTGKTYLAACVANALLDKGYRVKMTKFTELINKIQGMYEGKQEFIDNLNSYDLLIIDDLGTERKSEYMQEMVFNIIDSRYRAGLPFIVTTNLTLDEIKKPSSVDYARIYDRILERCFPIEVNGVSRRRQNVMADFFETKEKLGL